MIHSACFTELTTTQLLSIYNSHCTLSLSWWGLQIPKYHWSWRTAGQLWMTTGPPNPDGTSSSMGNRVGICVCVSMWCSCQRVRNEKTNSKSIFIRMTINSLLFQLCKPSRSISGGVSSCLGWCQSSLSFSLQTLWGPDVCLRRRWR